MDPDTTLLALLNLFTSDTPPTTEAVREYVEALGQWHHKRGFLPRWPVHLDSAHSCFATMRIDRGEPGAELHFRAECIALLTRVQVAIEEENRSLYIAAVSNLGAWAMRALDSEPQEPVGVGEHLSPRWPLGDEPNTKIPSLPADWRCPTCKTHTGTPTKYGVTCANGHESL